MKSKKYQKSISSLAIVTALVASGCGSEDSSSSTSTDSSTSTTLSSVSLSELPSASSMVSSTTSSVSLNDDYQNSSLAVSGRAPLLVSLTSGHIDTVFFNGLLSTINTSATWSSKTAQQKKDITAQFWGSSSTGPGGSGACRMAQSVGESLSRMLRAGASACYMKGMTKASSGVTITSGTAVQKSLFDKGDADKLVKVAVSGGGGGGTMDVFIKVLGKNTIGTTKYKTELFFCSAGTVTGRESVEVDLSTGIMTSKNTHLDSGYKAQELVVATLKAKTDGSSGFDFDSSGTRSAKVISSSDNGTFKGELEIKGGTITGKRYYSSSSWGTDKNYSITNFTGSGLSSLRFTEGAYKGENSWTQSGTAKAHRYSGATEWQNTYYASTQSSQMYTDVQSYQFASDEFFTSIVAPTIDFSDLSCAVTPDVAVTFDMADAGAAVQVAKCDEDRYDNYDLCYSTDIRAAENVLRADNDAWN